MEQLKNFTPTVQLSTSTLVNNHKENKLKNALWTTDIRCELPIFLATSGVGSIPPITVMDLFEQTVKEAKNEEALFVERDGKWISWTWNHFHKDTINFAKAMINLGIKPYECVNLLAFNSPEWFAAFLGGIYASVVPVGIYLTNNSQTCMYIADHSECGCLVLDSIEQFKKYDLSKLKHLKAVVFIGSISDKELNSLANPYVTVYSWKNILDIGKKSKVELELHDRMSMQQPGNCCNIVYTSGTTGTPKAVMLSHDNMTWMTRAIKMMHPEFVEDNQRAVSYLPLSHIAGQVVDIFMSILTKSQVWFAKPDALSGSLLETLKVVNPTTFFGVPRVYEKMEDKIKATFKESGSVKQALLQWAMKLGSKAVDNSFNKEGMPWFYTLANFLVFRRIKNEMGLGETKSFSFGAAPMKKSTLSFFKSLSIPLFNSYGMSESTGPQFMNMAKTGVDLKSAGINVKGTDFLIFNPDKDGQGEICFRGRNRFMGYYKNEAATLETIDEAGFIHSGDQGYINEKGFLIITGRFKEILKTAGGEMVAPVPIEEAIASSSSIFNIVVVIGDDRKYLSALLTLKTDSDGNLLPDVLKIFKDINPDIKTVIEAMNDPKIKGYINGLIESVNKNAASRAQLVRRWTILPHEFSVDSGEITPTLKLKRKFIAQKYAKEIEMMYKEARM